VKPLSTFGFADDYYEQEVSWHAPSEGIRSIEALLQGLGSLAITAPGVAEDLRTLASVLRITADQGIDFSLMLRLSAKDGMQSCGLAKSVRVASGSGHEPARPSVD
jgi:hypothetical protein